MERELASSASRCAGIVPTDHAHQPDVERHDGAAARPRRRAALKDRVDGVIAMSGCATTVRGLLGEGLLDTGVLHPRGPLPRD